MAQWLMATMNPPGLACIVPYDGLVDQYRGSNYHGGIFCSYRSVWYTALRADNQHRPAGRQGRPPMRFDLVGAITEHTLDDEFWRVRSPYWRLDQIKCPVLSIGHWGKMGLHLRGNILGYEEVKAPKKLVVTGARNTFEAHRMFDQVEFHEKECLPFYDLHLKGTNSGFMDGAPVKLYVRAPMSGAPKRNGRPSARSTCRISCVRGRRTASPRSTTARFRPSRRRRMSRPPATPIRTGSGSMAWW
jgi:predicted acyl esterase